MTNLKWRHQSPYPKHSHTVLILTNLLVSIIFMESLLKLNYNQIITSKYTPHHLTTVKCQLELICAPLKLIIQNETNDQKQIGQTSKTGKKTKS